MDFSLSSDQEALRDLTRQITGAAGSPEHLRELALHHDGTDMTLWSTMATSGLVGIGLPESVGGGGLGFLEVCVVLSEVARAGNVVPALAVMALGASALARAGADDALAGVADGSRIVTAALHEAVGDVRSPAAVFDGATVTGMKVCVPAGTMAAALVVSVSSDNGPGLVLVDAGADGVTVERQDTTTGVPEACVCFEGAPARWLGGAEALERTLQEGSAAAAVMVAAACEAALGLTTEYAKGRVQFERPIATFQAVGQRIADAYIDTEAIRLSAWQAAWRLAEGHDAATQVATAKFWAAEGGQRVVHAAQHVHGGVGVDRDYPLHRYFLMVKQLELQLGSAHPSLAHLGRLIAQRA